MELMGARRGICKSMDTHEEQSHLQFTIPARGLIGLRNRLMTATRGTIIMHHNFYEYEFLRGSIRAARPPVISHCQGDRLCLVLCAARVHGERAYDDVTRLERHKAVHMANG